MAPIVASKAPSASNNTRTSARSSSSAKHDDPETKNPTAIKKTSTTTTTISRSAVSSNQSNAKTEASSSRVVRKDIKTPPSSSSSRTTTPTSTTTALATASKAVGVSERFHKPHPLPSQTLNKHKQAAVWTSGKKKHKTNFGSAYDSGCIPCRINHGGIKNQLQWTKDKETVDFNPLLVTCVEGFQETEHPFVFLARTAFRELMQLEDARKKTIPILSQVIPPLRGALMSKEEDIFIMALQGTRMLSDVVDKEMNIYLPKLTQQIHRKLLTKQLRQQVEDTLATLERNGGKEALNIIRSKIPTYVSIN